MQRDLREAIERMNPRRRKPEPVVPCALAQALQPKLLISQSHRSAWVEQLFSRCALRPHDQAAPSNIRRIIKVSGTPSSHRRIGID
jgi:hypothetical protein